jgi:hypothetical protein
MFNFAIQLWIPLIKMKIIMISKRVNFSVVSFLFLFFILLSLQSTAQESDRQKSDDFWRRVSVGGYLSFQFGNVTGIVVSPEASVRLVDQLYGGLGFTYQYYWYKNYYYDTRPNPPQWLNYSESVYGGRIFFRYYLRSLFDNFLGNVFAHTEYEYLYYVRPYKYDPRGSIIDPYGNTFSPGQDAVEVNSIFLGGGYSQPIGGRAYLDLMILFNLNDTYNSPYSNPVFRIGFGVGL